MILAAAKLDPDSDIALSTASRLAATTGVKLVVFHCISRPAFPLTFTEDSERKAKEEAQRRLRERLKHLGLNGETEIVVRVGSPARTINEVCGEYGVGTVVLGPHRPRGTFDGLLGSTGERILRTGRIPCLLAKQQLSVPPRRVLVTTDFSSVSVEALRVALTWLGKVGGNESAIVEVLYTQTVTGLGEMPRDVDFGPYFQPVLEMAELPNRLKLRPRVLVAPTVFDGVSRAAKEMDAELIVMGTHGRSFTSRLLIGSVTTACARQLSHPLLLVPPSGQEAATRSRG